ncbi:DUF4025 domain-containing protein [Bacillus sp. CLL-7-23]|uniref:DUF4025 domain-containing protein n=1 Tax=Bacillus changyiensis TaxID=3004103 RepID=A0ABT4X6T3_9BACI|nr:DUF4025 domain-containing protein [Bacillus changyiensis]MDA7027807.1 DUF4025 domain-containing protein [Bacillus changyiensis]
MEKSKNLGEGTQKEEREGITVTEEQISDTYMEGTIEDEDRN